MTDPIMPTTTLSDFSVDNQSLTLEVLNVQVKCDLVTLDIGLNDSYIKLLEEGKKLTLNYNTFISQYQTVGGQTYVSINISKSFTRLKSVFFSLWKDYPDAPRTEFTGGKNWNDFFYPMSMDTDELVIDTTHHLKQTYNKDGDFEFNMHIESKLYPEYPIRSHAEAYYQLRKTLGHQSSSVHSFPIAPEEYRYNKMVIAIDTEKGFRSRFDRSEY